MSKNTNHQKRSLKQRILSEMVKNTYSKEWRRKTRSYWIIKNDNTKKSELICETYTNKNATTIIRLLELDDLRVKMFG